MLEKALPSERPSVPSDLRAGIASKDPNLVDVVRTAAAHLTELAKSDGELSYGLTLLGASEVTLGERLIALNLSPERTFLGR
jgi:hypothetical protein